MEVLGKPRTTLVLVWGVPAGTGEHPWPAVYPILFFFALRPRRVLEQIGARSRNFFPSGLEPEGSFPDGSIIQIGRRSYSIPFRGKGNEGRFDDPGTLLYGFPSEDGRPITGWIPGPIRSPFLDLREDPGEVPGWSLGD
jgi:hypothetical protein